MNSIKKSQKTQTKIERKQKTTTLQAKPTTSSWTTNPKEQKKTLNTMSTSNLAVILITDKCFHSYSYHLQPDFAGNYGKETFKSYTKIISSGLVGWGVPIRTEGICEYVVVNIKQA